MHADDECDGTIMHVLLMQAVPLIHCNAMQESDASLAVRMALGETHIVNDNKAFLRKNGADLDSFDTRVCAWRPLVCASLLAECGDGIVMRSIRLEGEAAR
jgi:hypothetical protein